MRTMDSASNRRRETDIRGATPRRGRLRLAIEVPEPPRGRAWINGREVGGADPRYQHLARSYD
jgi:hypothetical protein